MKLNIKPVSQRDPKWANKKLANSTVLTIGSDGCALCCVAMVCSYFGHPTTPDQLNDDLKRHNGFYNNLLVWGAVSDIYSDIVIDWNNYFPDLDVAGTQVPLDKIDEILASGRPVICKVDYSPAQGLQEHWVLIIGKNNDYIINDPYTGEEYYFTAKIGDPKEKIYKMVVYAGKIPEEPEDNLGKLTEENKKLREQLANEIKLVGELRTKIAGLEQDAEGREAELKELHDRNRTLEIKTGNQEKEVKTLKDVIDVLVTENTQLKSNYSALQTHKLRDFSSRELLKEIIRRLFTKEVMKK